MYNREEDLCFGIKQEPNIGLKILMTLTNKYTNVFTECCPYKKVYYTI